jgi:hypothetical protein
VPGPVPFGTLAVPSVRTLTRLQLGVTAVPERRERHDAFVAAALGLPPGAAVPRPAWEALRSAFRRAARLPCANSHKEPFWRVAVNGVPACGGHDPSLLGTCPTCPCMAAADLRVHCFWECPLASAVVSEVRRCLPPEAGALTRRQLWLATPPTGVHSRVWLLVCLAAFSAMHHGLRQAWRLRLSAPDPAPAAPGPVLRQVTIQEALGLPPPPAAAPAAAPRSVPALAADLAVVRFWWVLDDMVHGADPSLLPTMLSEDHPFIGMRADGGPVVHRPLRPVPAG